MYTIETSIADLRDRCIAELEAFHVLVNKTERSQIAVWKNGRDKYRASIEVQNEVKYQWIELPTADAALEWLGQQITKYVRSNHAHN